MVQEREGSLSLSPSSATGCLRQKILRREHPYYLDPEREYKTLIGKGIHKAQETGSEYEEFFLSMPLVYPDGIEVPVNGRLDEYVPEHARIEDDKTVDGFIKWNKEAKARVKTPLPRPYDEVQVNLYAMLLRHNGYPVESAQINYLKRADDAARQVVKVELWEPEDVLMLAYELAAPLAEYIRSGRLPDRLADNHPFCKTCPVRKPCGR